MKTAKFLSVVKYTIKKLFTKIIIMKGQNYWNGIMRWWLRTDTDVVRNSGEDVYGYVKARDNIGKLDHTF